MNKFKINIDYSKDSLFDELGLRRLKESYMLENESSPQERFAFVSAAFATNQEHAQRLYDYSSKHWLSYSTPILSFGRNRRGLPISCYLSYLEDTAEGLVNTLSEINWLSMMGGGVGIHIGIRGADDKSVGVMPHLKVYDASCLAYKQGTTRRGSYATYLDISHPDIIQFLEMRKPTGDQNMRALNLNHAINISDDFMKIVERCMIDPLADDSWNLIQPNSGKVVETVSAKDLWMRILEMRMQTGEPYIWFNDTANRTLKDYQKALGLSIKGSNLCSEISLPTDKDRTAVCCLSSVNLEYYDDWKLDKQFLPDILEMLDNVLEYFIQNAPDTISRAKYSAYRERSVGVGALGFHAYLQKHNIPFESVVAKSANNRIFKHISTELEKKNISLAEERGSCPDAEEHGVKRRLTNITAIAPNACQTKEGTITTIDGVKTIEQLLTENDIKVADIEKTDIKLWYELKNPVTVDTLSGPREVEKIYYNGNSNDVFEIEFADGTLGRFTGNHRLMVDLGNDWTWKYVKDITEDDNILTKDEFFEKGYVF